MLPEGRREYFERLYGDTPDPWGFETRWYEQRKYALTVAALPEARYRSGFEPGCSIGVLTELLASRCDHLLATDIVPAVVERAAQRVAGRPHVRVEQRAVPEDWPQGPFDLVVLSEVAYYLPRPALEVLVGRAVATLEPGGVLEAVHWRGATDYALSGDAAHAVIAAHGGLTPVAHYEEVDFLLDVWRRTGPAGAERTSAS
jgi:predicted TPR repeat methyltransferase